MKITDYNMSRKPDINEDGKVYELGPFFDKGINFPFQLYIPNVVRENCDLIVTGRTPNENNKDSLEKNIDDAKAMKFSYASRGLSFKYGNPMLLPVIPRFHGVQSTSLGYLLYHNDYHEAQDWIEKGWLNISSEELHRFDNLHEQILKMIDYTLEFIKNKGYQINDKVVMTGYSAAANFASRFAALHPERVKAIIAGGNGGEIFLPMKKYHDWVLDYPIGSNDLPNFNFEEFQKIKQFYYVGDDDYNTSATPSCVMQVDSYDEKGNAIFARDESGNKIPLKDDSGNLCLLLDSHGNMTSQYGEAYFSHYQINAINKGISTNSQERFATYKDIYESMGIDAIFQKYHGDHVTVNDCDLLYDDIFVFYEKNIMNNQKAL